ncbi:LLM class flavin-dependent oxidoreductase, partial [Sphingobium yanoikuyae]|uniref:LLM class flavin-dependent oxidoreductase n=1 Tax=Sphingobium yanoikuyae TaxID=13690 RepID=UPI000564ED3E
MATTASGEPQATVASAARGQGYEAVFQPGKLTFGFIAPLESYPDSPAPSMRNHLDMARTADDAGFSVIWLRDVPFYDPSFGDLGQLFDPISYAGYLAAATRRIAIGTAGIVLPLRDPLAIAKQATTLDHLTDNRFILGLSSGDRPVEYPAFGIDFDSRAERFREAYALIRAVTEQNVD